MQSVTDPSEYAAAWKTYRTRWILTWVSLLSSFGLVVLFATGAPRIHVALAILIGISPYVVSYLWFLRWRCPRCGERFTMPDGHALKRSKQCSHCGLPKNFIPEHTDYPVR